MPTAPSWAELRAAPAQLGALLRLRAATLRRTGRRRAVAGLLLVVVVTVLAVALAAYLPGLDRTHAGDVLALLPTLCVGFLGLSVLASVVTGGGRELLPREQAVAFPVSHATEYAGSLLLAQLNIAWLLQVWTLLAAGAYALRGHALVPTELVVLAWVVLATVLGHAVGWSVEAVRRGPHGSALVGSAGLLTVAAGTVLDVTHRVGAALDGLPTAPVLGTVLAGGAGHAGRWALGMLGLAVGTAVALAVGVVGADTALRRPERAELRQESARVAPRADARSLLAAAVRIDRGSVWRAVPLRRGLAVLALVPGALALVGRMPWTTLTLLPGMVASGAALLFGVNAWCLDGRGGLWRESLPVPPRVAYWAKAVVLAEVLCGAAVVTAGLGALRAGRPSSAELAALASAALVVCLQVVAASLRWSVARPFHTDLRSARATPAPPLSMVGYSARLALSTTVTGLLFSGAAGAGDWRTPLALAVVLGAWSGRRLWRGARAWDDHALRSHVVTTVAG
ncbi:MAG: hypothetical protein ACTHNS_11490 [Marmoricola sp.]